MKSPKVCVEIKKKLFFFSSYSRTQRLAISAKDGTRRFHNVETARENFYLKTNLGRRLEVGLSELSVKNFRHDVDNWRQ